MIHSLKIRSTLFGGLLCLGAGLAAPAHAVTPIGAPARSAPGTAPSASPPAAAAVAPSLDLIGGTIAAVDPGRSTITIAGAALVLHPTQLRVFNADGAVRGSGDLRPGAQIRFALEPGVTEPRRVVLIYLDGRS